MPWVAGMRQVTAKPIGHRPVTDWAIRRVVIVALARRFSRCRAMGKGMGPDQIAIAGFFAVRSSPMTDFAVALIFGSGRSATVVGIAIDPAIAVAAAKIASLCFSDQRFADRSFLFSAAASAEAGLALAWGVSSSARSVP